MTNPRGDSPDWLQPANYVYSRLFGTFIAAGGSSIAVGQWATIHVLLGNVDHTSLLSAVYQFVDSASGFIVDQGVLSADTTDVAPQFPSWNLPVVADTFIIFPLGASVIAEVIATNRVLPKGMTGNYQPIRTFAGTVAANAPAGTTVELVGVDNNGNNAIPQINCSNYNGQVAIEWFGSAASPTGNGFIRYIDATGVEQTALTFQNFSTTIQRLITGHPFGYVRWRFVTNAVQGAAPSTLTLVVFPAEQPP